MIEAIRDYLALLEAPREAEDDRLQALAEVLDRLAFAYHRTPETSVEDAADPPEAAPYRQRREAAVRAFPNFGFYTGMKALDRHPPPEESVGDAIDDLAELAIELQQIRWRWENNGPEDAAWHFRFGYRSHWGRHLHDLRRYVHAQQFGG